MRPRTALLIIAVPLLLHILFYYRGFYIAPHTEGFDPGAITVTELQPRPFQDEVAPSKGAVIFDSGDYRVKEISSLLNRITARDVPYEFLEDRSELANKLKYASAYVVISPDTPFDDEERDEVRRFLDKGGRLLLLSDPQRADVMNSLAVSLGIIFEDGYLYNMEENDGNFRNIFQQDFGDFPVTEGLERVVLYSACPVSGLEPVMTGDDNTRSSIKETGGPFSPAVGSEDILALCDHTFLQEPFDGLEDNPALISNIADFLTWGERTFLLEDFPYFLGDEVNVVYTDPNLLEQALDLKDVLGREVVFAQGDDDLIFLGLYGDLDGVSGYLEKANITISGDVIEMGGVPDIGRDGSAFMYIMKEDSRNVVIILGDTKDDLDATIDLLETGKFRNYLLDDRTMVVPSGKDVPVQMEAPEPVPETEGI